MENRDLSGTLKNLQNGYWDTKKWKNWFKDPKETQKGNIQHAPETLILVVRAYIKLYFGSFPP